MIALYNLGKAGSLPAQVSLLARQQAAVTHAHPLAQDGAALVASAVWSAWAMDSAKFQPQHWFLQVVEKAGLQESAAWNARCTQAMQWLAADSKTPAPDAREVARQLGRGVGAIDSCITAIYVAARFMRNDFWQMLQFVRRGGGDVDTIGAMAGSIFGAARGEQALPAAALDRLENCDAIRRTAIKFARDQ